MVVADKDTVIDELLAAGTRAMQFGMEKYVPPPILYHFTDARGAVGILSSRTLWASRAMSLNDASEVRYGIDKTVRYLAKRLETEKGPKRILFLQHTLQWLRAKEVTQDLVVNVDPFVVSFCSNIDKSSHWLHYGHSGKGYVLSCDPKRLKQAPFDLVKVIYDSEEQEAVIDGAVRIIEERFLDLAFAQDGDTIGKAGGVASHLCATAVRAIAVRLKHPAFESEDEWRLATLDLSGGRVEDHGFVLKHGYRTIDDRIIPYLIAEYETGVPVSEIVVGSRVDLPAAEGALGFLFRQEKIEPSPAVRQSDVPVR